MLANSACISKPNLADDMSMGQRTGVYPFFEGRMGLRPMFMRVRWFREVYFARHWRNPPFPGFCLRRPNTEFLSHRVKEGALELARFAWVIPVIAPCRVEVEMP